MTPIRFRGLHLYAWPLSRAGLTWKHYRHDLGDAAHGASRNSDCLGTKAGRAGPEHLASSPRSQRTTQQPGDIQKEHGTSEELSWSRRSGRGLRLRLSARTVAER